MMRQISQTIEQIVIDTDRGNVKEKETLEKLYKSRCNNKEQIIEQKRIKIMNKKISKREKQNIQQNNEQEISKTIRKSSAKPQQRTQRIRISFQ